MKKSFYNELEKLSFIGPALTGLFAAQSISEAAKKSKEVFRKKATGPQTIRLGRYTNYPMARR